MVSGWCPCVPLGRRQSTAQQQQQQQQRPSSSRAPFTVCGATDRADMVQMFYYENRGKCCKKLLRYNGYPNKVLLFPEEGWARSASSSYWTLTPFWWSRSRCKVVEVAGTRSVPQILVVQNARRVILVEITSSRERTVYVKWIEADNANGDRIPYNRSRVKHLSARRSYFGKLGPVELSWRP
ncbi:uncharacterized protein [Cardiocondyla obscurior]|uniref:uncharacterized protein isoform X2 n=1 Tax=Cardiocondyla obscurior TaxID=286306 RepID=UPI0039656C62